MGPVMLKQRLSFVYATQDVVWNGARLEVAHSLLLEL